MLKAGIFLAFVFVAIAHASGDQNSVNERLQKYSAYGRPNSMIFIHPTRSLVDKRNDQHIFLPRPNNLMNAYIRGKKFTEPSADALKRYLAYGRPNSMIFMHPTRSLTEKRSGIYLPRPNSLMNAIKGKRGQQVYLPRPNSLMNAIQGKRSQQVYLPRPNSLMNAIQGKRSQQVYLPRPNSLMNAIQGKRAQQIYLPRPNSLMNAIKGKRAFLHGSPNSFNFPIWTRSAMDVDESEDDDEEFESGEVADIANFYEGIEKYGKRDGNFDVFLGNRG